MSKPEMSYDRDTESFERDGKRIGRQQAVDHWVDVDSEWTMGAHNRMWEILNNLEPYSLSGGRDA